MKLIQDTIATVDRMTTVVNKINNSLERMNQPILRLGMSLKRLGDVSGINRLAKGIAELTLKIKTLLGSVLKLGAPLLNLFNTGMITGLYKMTEEWGRFGAATKRTSQILNIATNDLMAWQNMGTLFGVSTDQMTQGIRSFSDTLQDVKFGKNEAAANMLKKLGISLKYTQTGAIDTETVLLRLADKIKAIQQRDPADARKLAQSLGVEELLPVLMQGSKAMRTYQDEVKRLQGNITSDMIDRANSFSISIDKMKIAANGTKVAIADKLIPVFQPLIQRWTEWLVVNRQNISDKIAVLAERLKKWLEQINFENVLNGILRFIDGCVQTIEWIDKTVDKFGGWENVLKGLGVFLAIGFVAQMGVAGLAVAGLALEFGIAYVAATRLRDELMKFESFQVVNDVLGSVLARVFGSKEDKETIKASDAAQDAERYKNRPENPAWYSNDGVFRFMRKIGLDGYMKENQVSSSSTNFKLPVLNPSYDVFKKSIITQESQGNYSAVSKRTGAMGFAQIMPGNIVGWGKNAGKKKHGWDFEALGYDITPQQFLASRELQNKIVDFKLKQAYEKYGAVGAARWWYSNNPNSSDKRPRPNEPSPNQYASEVISRMMKSESKNNSVLQPQVNLTVQNTVHANTAITTKVTTPQGVKIKHNAPGVMN